MRQFANLLWTAFKFAVIAGTLYLSACSTTRTILKQAPNDIPSGWQGATYNPLPEPLARERLQTHIYGSMGERPNVAIVAREIISKDAYDGRATLVQWRLDLDYGAASRPLDLVALLPNSNSDATVILSQNFCPNPAVVPLEGVRMPDQVGFDCSGGGLLGGIFGYVFGRYIVTPPLQDILDRGYGFAAIYPSQFVPDRADSGLETLALMFPDHANRPGALAVWAGLFDVMAGIIEADQGERRMIAYGHSRFAKTALLAAAWSENIDAALAHQSGTLGASALDDREGESVEAIVESYPHWPGPGLTAFASIPETLPIRPADLLALTGGKPILLGNARRDVWSDPWGAFKEARAAWDDDLFAAASPSDFRPSDVKAFWQRPGTHGVVKEDWPAFLDFLDVHSAQTISSNGDPGRT